MHVGGEIFNDKKILKSIWLPILGFNKKYTLRLSPKSHLYNHPENKFINQKKSISNIFKNSYLQKFKFKRINLRKGEGIFFHPNLLHGGSDNLGSRSRVSLEFRLYNLKKKHLWYRSQ